MAKDAGRTKRQQEFAERLREVCDDMGLPERGRQTRLAEVAGVSQPRAGRWLDGAGYPEMHRAIAIADWADVNVTWLLQGLGPKRGTKVDTRALLLDEVVRSLPPELGIDLIDNLRAKLQRIGRITAEEPESRYQSLLNAYEHDLAKRKQH